MPFAAAPAQRASRPRWPRWRACCVARATASVSALGVIASIRTHPAAETLVGYLLNTLPVELTCPDGATFRELTSEAGAVVGRALAHRAYPLADIVADRRAAGAAPPAINVLLAFHELRSSRLGTHRVEHEVLFNGSAVADATFFVEVHDDRVDLAVEYRGTVMTERDATRLLGDFDALARPGARRSVGHRFDTMAVPSHGASVLSSPALAEPMSVLERILENIERHGAEPAVTCGDETITWAELGRRSGQLAARLRAASVDPGDRVIVCLPRSADLIAAIIAVLRVGAAYVPIDPGYPEARIRLIAELAGADVALVADPDRSLTGADLVVDEAITAPPPTRRRRRGAAVGRRRCRLHHLHVGVDRDPARRARDPSATRRQHVRSLRRVRPAPRSVPARVERGVRQQRRRVVLDARQWWRTRAADGGREPRP